MLHTRIRLSRDAMVFPASAATRCFGNWETT